MINTMEKNILKRSKYLVVSLVLTCAFTTCNSAQHKAIAADCDCKKIKFPSPKLYPYVFDSLASKSYPIILSKDSTVIGIWMDAERYIDIYIYYSKNNKIYRQLLETHSFGYEKKIDYTFYENRIGEFKLDKHRGLDIILSNYDFQNKRYNNVFDYISKKEGALINIYHDTIPSLIYRKIDSITQPLAERNEYVKFCQTADTNTIGWFPGGGIMSRPYKKGDNYYLMMISSGGWECFPADFSILKNGDMRFEGGPFGVYYVVTKDTNEFKQYSPTGKLISTDKRQIDYNYMDYPAYYLFHTVYGYNGKFIPLPPK